MKNSASIQNDNNKRYLSALGSFVNAFSLAETVVYDFLVKMAGIDPVIGPAIFSGTRMDAGITTIKRIYGARGLAIEAAVETSMERILAINGVRNKILHYGAKYESDDPTWIVTNARIALTPDKVQDLTISPEILDRMSADLGLASVILAFATTLPDDPVVVDPDQKSVLEAAWSDIPKWREHMGRTRRPRP